MEDFQMAADMTVIVRYWTKEMMLDLRSTLDLGGLPSIF
jgi:hypothetical protein